MHLSKENCWEGERGKGERGGSEYSQPGIRVDGNSRHDTKRRDFQVREGFPSKGGISK
jgi:hypothetical protein